MTEPFTQSDVFTRADAAAKLRALAALIVGADRETVTVIRLTQDAAQTLVQNLQAIAAVVDEPPVPPPEAGGG